MGKISFEPISYINEVSAKRSAVQSVWELLKEISEGRPREDTSPVSFEGLIMVKGFRLLSREVGIAPETFERNLEEHGVGLGRGDKFLHLRIRDLSTVDIIDLYMDVADHLFPLGLLPGRAVQVRRVQMKLSGVGHYFVIQTPYTTITTKDFIPSEPVAVPRATRLGYLIDLSRNPQSQLVSFDQTSKNKFKAS